MNIGKKTKSTDVIRGIAMSKLKDIALKAFELQDWITGCDTGGIEAPRRILDAIENDSGVTIKWKHPDTCGLSDCRYHYSDTSVHSDVFSLRDGNILELNGQTFAFTAFDKLMVKDETDAFYEEFGLRKQA